MAAIVRHSRSNRLLASFVVTLCSCILPGFARTAPNSLLAHVSTSSIFLKSFKLALTQVKLPARKSPMKRIVNRRHFLTVSTLTTLGLCAGTAPWASAAETRKKKLLYYTCSAGFEHSVVKRNNGQLSWSERILTELGQKHGFDVECTKDGSVFDRSLDPYDVIAFYTSGMLTQPDQYKNPPMTLTGKKRLLDAITAGKGFVGIHPCTDSFHTPGKRDENQDPPDPYIAMLGGEFIRHGPQQVAAVRVSSPKFPGVEEMHGEFKALEEWYTHKNFAGDLHVILVMQTQGMQGDEYNRPPYPAAWARLHGKGRVFYTAFGHREDIWTNPVIQKHLVGGISWAFKNVDVDVTPNIQKVTPKAWVLKNP